MHNLRSAFPIFKKRPELIYFDAAATAQKPSCVIDAMKRFYEEDYGTVHRAVYELAASATAHYHRVRLQIASFLNSASSEEIVFTRGTTDGLNLIASSFGEAFVFEGDEILISAIEHHSNIVPWQMLCQKKKALLRIIPVTDSGELDIEAYENFLTERTKLVSIAHVSHVTGTLHPVEKIISLAHKKGARVVIDGAQSAGHMQIDVQKMNADFFVFSGHKLFGPTGVGVLFGKKELLEKMPPCQGGGDMIEKVTLASSTYQKPPLRFEAGTPMIAEVIGLGAALTFLESIGRDQIYLFEQELLNYATQKCLEIEGLRLIGSAPHKGAILTFVVDGIHPLDIASLLDAKGIAVRSGHLCAQPAMERFGISTAVRASFAPYNTFEEIDKFASALQESLAFLRNPVVMSNS